MYQHFLVVEVSLNYLRRLLSPYVVVTLLLRDFCQVPFVPMWMIFTFFQSHRIYLVIVYAHGTVPQESVQGSLLCSVGNEGWDRSQNVLITRVISK